jgi:hypothetical protein
LHVLQLDAASLLFPPTSSKQIGHSPVKTHVIVVVVVAAEIASFASILHNLVGERPVLTKNESITSSLAKTSLLPGIRFLSSVNICSNSLVKSAF